MRSQYRCMSSRNDYSASEQNRQLFGDAFQKLAMISHVILLSQLVCTQRTQAPLESQDVYCLCNYGINPYLTNHFGPRRVSVDRGRLPARLRDN